MANLYYPASGFLARVAPLDIRLFPPIHHVRDVAVLLDGVQARRATITGVGAQVLTTPMAGSLALDSNGVESRLKPLAVVDVGSGDDDR